MNRRSFLQSMLAAAAAPAIVRADSLMRIVPAETIVFPPPGGGWGAISYIRWYNIQEDAMFVRLAALVAEGREDRQYHVDYRDDFRKGDHASAANRLKNALQGKQYKPPPMIHLHCEERAIKI